MISTLGHINERYGMKFDDREMTPFEKEIFNSKKMIDYSKMNLDNIEILNSLSIYYDIEINKLSNEMKGSLDHNIKSFIFINERLSKFGSSKGFLRLGVFFATNNDMDKAIEYFQKGIEMNDDTVQHHRYNLAICFCDIGRVDEALELLKISLIFSDSIFMISTIYYDKCDFFNSLKWLEYGIYKSDKECMDFFHTHIFENSTLFYEYLLLLPFTNESIENKKRELSPSVDQDKIDFLRELRFLLRKTNPELANAFIKLEPKHNLEMKIQTVPYNIGSSVELIEIYG